MLLHIYLTAKMISVQWIRGWETERSNSQALRQEMAQQSHEEVYVTASKQKGEVMRPSPCYSAGHVPGH